MALADQMRHTHRTSSVHFHAEKALADWASRNNDKPHHICCILMLHDVIASCTQNMVLKQVVVRRFGQEPGWHVYF
jgi:hypothetical protein